MQDPRKPGPPRWLAVATLVAVLAGVALGVWIYRILTGTG